MLDNLLNRFQTCLAEGPLLPLLTPSSEELSLLSGGVGGKGMMLSLS